MLYVDVLTAHDLQDVPGKDAVLLYGKCTSAYTGTMKMGFLFIPPCGKVNIPYAEMILSSSGTNLPSFYIISLPAENKLLCIEVISAYDNTFALGNGMIIPYDNAKKMDGSFIR
ncbi:hypothetical protein [Sphingobacterium arenae]|uniref:Uncharacterized protein n=1 Tax=Sphingobacterium arenae TaxID=1280598 RepID=A0ABR7Y5J5_9SPHI|nr:hypothetical protein [Sphingobacterium arenae]MBD1426578.1 hypothetical protein [Sphingobacterium arenae]